MSKIKLAVIGANEFQNPLIIRARELGYETHVFAWRDGAVGEKNADFFYPISILEKEEILRICEEIKIDGITSIGSDIATTTVNYVAAKMNLPGNTLKCTDISTNKYLMRKAFKDNGIETPYFILIDELSILEKLREEIEAHLPLIIKPTDRSGSRAIGKACSYEEVLNYTKKAMESSFEGKAIIEEYIEGEEFSIEGITYNGVHSFLAITRKATTGEPNFIETGHIEPSGLDKNVVNKIYNTVYKALDALGITNSATHCEFRISPNGDIRIIEIGARMGGDCIGSHLVNISTGYDFIKMVIDVSLGKSPDFTKYNRAKYAIVRFIFNMDDYNNYIKVKTEYSKFLYYESIIEKEEIKTHREVTDSSSRFGYYILAVEKLDDIRWLLNEFEKRAYEKF